MSKLNSLSQSMAALFTPESERARKTQASGNQPSSVAAAGFRVPGALSLQENSRSGDSLGNPASPGYEPLHLPKKGAAGPNEELVTAKAAEGFTAPDQGPEVIRLATGFEKLLLAQQKVCEKAVALFTKLDGPGRYHLQRRGKLLGGKSRGCIVDVHNEDSLAAPPKEEDAA